MSEELKDLGTGFESNRLTDKHRDNIFVEMKNNKKQSYNELKEQLINHGYIDFDKKLSAYDEFDGTRKSQIFEENQKIDFLIEYSCLSIENLQIHASGKLIFYNCLIKSDITFKFCDDLTIEFDSCIVLGKLNIRNGTKNNIIISLSNINGLNVSATNNSKLILSGTRLLNLNINGVQLERFILVDNYIEYYKLSELEVASKNYNDFDQFNLKNIGLNVPSNFDVDQFCLSRNGDIETGSGREKDYQQTIDALLELTSISYDKDKLAELRYRKSLLGNSLIGRMIVFATAGFRKPYLWLIYVLVFIFVFAVLYTMPFVQFDKGIILDIGDALYFSCITFATVGYGDIAPIGFTRVLCSIEGILGVSIMAGFITTLASKYTD